MNDQDIPVTTYTDVLIVGAGPSGLMAAYWMARCGVKARVVDKRSTKVFVGHADGLRPRTLELFDSMGFQHRVMHEASISTEANFWVPGEGGKLTRKGPFNMSRPDESPYHSTRLSQGRIERFLLDSIQEHSDLQVERDVIAESLEYDENLENDPDSYPITVKLHRHGGTAPSTPCGQSQSISEATREDLECQGLLPDDWIDQTQPSNVQSQAEIVRAKYLIGCDGAHSWTRKQLKIPVEGSNTDHIWGVIDVVPISNFPDVRRVSIIHNAAGTILIIPRERGLVRFYVPVHVCEAGSTTRFDRSTITPEVIRTRVQAILSPFTFDFKACSWWTVYQVGQRIASEFTKGDRIFLAGDAVHTHSPKMGLGMNMSMQDGFNVGWKVALVVAGTVQPAVLATYDLERHPLAEMLLDFDRHWSPMFTDRNPSEEKDTKAAAMFDIAGKFEDFADGWKVFYPGSCLVCKPGWEAIARYIVPGERLKPVKLRNQAEGGAEWTTRLLESDGRFHILVLAGDVRNPMQRGRLEALCQILTGQSAATPSPLDRYVSIPGRYDSPLDVLTVHSVPWKEAELFDFPDILRPLGPVRGWAYDKIWCDDSYIFDRYCDGTAYEKWGVDWILGALVVVRPDQYIGWVGELGDVDGMTEYLDKILIRK
ncbi:uncharacterized protein N7511_003420 [Penicillium nucicola]|uniref:uncharacterized protein n=1 Tax=Penicillium nucicola TaxID=1850975 RepID=UPI0025454D17|nr:uncharacterized protein N7511_003420 [Penicillium nucicola]KAJ5771369.1 hypothetical protein N7511_003420 [Penicillium nucicola]